LSYAIYFVVGTWFFNIYCGTKYKFSRIEEVI